MANRKELVRGLKYEVAALPLFIAAPVLFTIGTKAIKADGNYLFAIAGGILTVVAIFIGFKGIKIIVNALFD